MQMHIKDSLLANPSFANPSHSYDSQNAKEKMKAMNQTTCISSLAAAKSTINERD